MIKNIALFLQDIIITLIGGLKDLFVKNPPKKWLTGIRGDLLIVQGFGGRWTYMSTIGNLANSLGYKVHVLEKLGYNLKKIENSSQILEKYIRKENLKNTTIISHSKGGIIAKYFLVNSKLSNRVKKVISISSPFEGTLFAYIYFLNLYELTPKSKLIRGLSQNSNVNNKFINIYGIDNIVIPNKNLYLAGAENLNLRIPGHMLILQNKKTLTEIEKALAVKL